MRHLVACYGAAIAINLELVMGLPSGTPQQPTPLVRIDAAPSGRDVWHPNEVIGQGSPTPYIVVWELPAGSPTALDAWTTHHN
jgi:hypothetical protein